MRSGYSPLQKSLHWLTVLLVVAQWWTSAAIYRTHAHDPFGVGPDPIDLIEHKLHIYGGLLILGLTILRTEKGGKDDKEGLVEFSAKFRAEGKEHEHLETAIFGREEGKWVYVGQVAPKGQTVRRVERPSAST